MGLEWAYNGFDARQYFVQACARNLRLPISKSWPAMVKIIIQEGWDPNPQKRPNMKRIGTLLRGDQKHDGRRDCRESNPADAQQVLTVAPRSRRHW